MAADLTWGFDTAKEFRDWVWAEFGKTTYIARDGDGKVYKGGGDIFWRPFEDGVVPALSIRRGADDDGSMPNGNRVRGKRR